MENEKAMEKCENCGNCGKEITSEEYEAGIGFCAECDNLELEEKLKEK